MSDRHKQRNSNGDIERPTLVTVSGAAYHVLEELDDVVAKIEAGRSDMATHLVEFAGPAASPQFDTEPVFLDPIEVVGVCLAPPLRRIATAEQFVTGAAQTA